MTVYMPWLPAIEAAGAFRAGVAGLADGGWSQAVALAGQRLDFIQTNRLDAALAGVSAGVSAAAPVRLAILGSCTTAQLHAGIRVAGVRRGLPVAVHAGEYGQYWQELAGPDAALAAFGPQVVLFAFDAHHLAAGVQAGMEAAAAEALLEEVLGRIRACWRMAKAAFGCAVIQQMALPVHPALMGGNEHRLPGSRAGFVARVNAALPGLADAEGVALLALDRWVARTGLAAWHDPGLWHRAKQEISPAAAPLYGELVGRLVAALRGRSFKCLVLDLDNTLWGGVVGDDGLEGLVLGQGNALGEAFVGFQAFCRDLAARGVILAVCSKNDAARAAEPFERHPEMVLKRGDIACFVANWQDKPSNLRAIAAELNIGLDSLVFADDNPFERALVRAELPMVAVPELGDDPAHYAQIIADGGYFEAVAITPEDRARGAQYQGNQLRAQLQASQTDLPSYLRSLEMVLLWRGFDRVGLQRIVQLINKTNQFNLTTRRITEAEALAVMADPEAIGLQLRLTDRFGDNGIIAIVIGRLQAGGELVIDTWLMSCRVLGRQVEQTTLNLLAERARAMGAVRLVGEYVPSGRNAMVRDHYENLGFSVVSRGENGGSRAVLALESYAAPEVFIAVKEG